MSRKKPLLSEVLEELKKYKEGILLDKTVSIFYDEDDSERVLLKSAVLSNLSSRNYQSYKVMHYYQKIFDPNVIEIYVEKIKH